MRFPLRNGRQCYAVLLRIKNRYEKLLTIMGCPMKPSDESFLLLVSNREQVSSYLSLCLSPKLVCFPKEETPQKRLFHISRAYPFEWMSTKAQRKSFEDVCFSHSGVFQSALRANCIIFAVLLSTTFAEEAPWDDPQKRANLMLNHLLSSTHLRTTHAILPSPASPKRIDECRTFYWRSCDMMVE